MQTPMLVAALFALAPVLTAQDVTEAAASRKKPETNASFEALNKEFEAARKAWSDERRRATREAREKGEPAPPAKPSPAKEFAPRFLSAAREFAGKDEAIPFYGWVLANCAEEKPLWADAMRTLATDHVQSEGVEESLQWIAFLRIDGDEVRQSLGTFAEKSPHPSVRAAALYARATLTGRARRGAAPTQEQLASATKDLKKAIELAPDSAAGKRSKGLLYETENLQVGMAAPQIEGPDLDGVGFKLTDYRGKVVLLDFWGDW
jgi:hypothetical protein